MSVGEARTSTAAENHEPVLLLELELGRPPTEALTHRSTGKDYRRARVLVRLHGAPLGAIDLPLQQPEVDTADLVALARRELREAIHRHLEDDGLPPDSSLTAEDAPQPRCQRKREAFRETAPFASVVIATRDRPESLAATLDDILAQAYPRFEVVVVDNAPSNDATQLLVEGYGRPDVRYVCEPLPGLAVAHNRGLAHARGDVVAFTDDDVLVDRLWLVELARGFELAEDVACVTGLIFPAELDTPAQVWLEDWVGVNKGYETRIFDLRRNRPKGKLFPYTAGAFGSGANMAFRTETLRTLGGFDPATGTGTRARGGDDLAAFFSVIAAGHALAYQPSAIVHHAYRRDVESLHRQMYDYGAGLGAFLTKVVVDRPSRMFDLAWRVPFGVAHALRSRPSRSENETLSTVNGSQLAGRERLGMLAGPTGYLIERHRRRALFARHTSRHGEDVSP